MKTQFQFLGANPQIAFIDSLGKCLYNNDPRRPMMVPTAADLAQINENRVLDIYKQEFSNADGFHFFLVGNADEASLKPLLEKYIASLPVKGNTPAMTDNGLRPVMGGRKMEFKKGQEQQSLVLSFYRGEMPFSESGKVQLDMIGQLLTIKVIEQIREEMGAMYSGGFSGSLQQYPYAGFTVQGYMPCGPDNVTPILKKVEEVVGKLKTNGPDQKDLEKVKITMLEKRREMIKTNDYWTAKLEQLLFWDNSKAYFLNFETELNKFTAADIKATAAQVFNNNNSFTGVLLPE
jgi:zinc protease